MGVSFFEGAKSENQIRYCDGMLVRVGVWVSRLKEQKRKNSRVWRHFYEFIGVWGVIKGVILMVCVLGYQS